MGQQQLLLVILVTIIVGIATVVALNVFGSSAANANEDAVRNDVLGIGTASQGWYIKPVMMGGGGNSFGGMTFNDFNFSFDDIDATTGLTVANMNGTYVINGNAALADGAQTFDVIAHPASCAGYNDTPNNGGVGGTCAAADQLEATVLQADIQWAS